MTPVELDSSALKRSVAFTGRLACMTRAEAFEMVRQHGGTPSLAVTKGTNLLIVGELGWPLLDDGRPSNKLSRANAYGIPVASERRFLEWIGKAVPDSVQKTYSADQLAALSKLSSDKIHELAQFGLLDEQGDRFGFRDLASARQIAKLLGDGVRLSEITRAVSQIRKWLPEVGLANVRLHAGPHKSLEVEQPGGRTNQDGQFVLAVDQSQNNPDDLFEQAQSAEEAGDIAEAERLYRMLMKSDRRTQRRRSILGTCYGPQPATSKRKRHCGRQRAPIRHSRTLGTISVTYWMSKDALKLPSTVCAQRCEWRLITLMRCSIWRSYCNEQADMPRRQITGANTLPTIANRNGLRGRADR